MAKLTLVSQLLIVLWFSTVSISATEREKRLVLDDGDNLSKQVNQLQQELAALRTDLTDLQRGIGSVYVRWGRKACPASASLVYTGFTAGKKYTDKGSGTDTLCLPSEPSWSRFTDGNPEGQRAYIYGTEIHTDDSQFIFINPVNKRDMPCAVCRSSKSSTLMIPARNNCSVGWTMEYNGYLMASDHTYYAFDHLCMDGSPEFLDNDATYDNEHLMYLVEGHCGSLPCPPYVQGRELACVVCTK